MRIVYSTPMPLSSFSFIFACWSVFALYWLITALSVKRTVARERGWGSLYHIALFVAAWVLLTSKTDLFNVNIQLIPRSMASGMIGGAICLLGLIIAIWARHTLGRNWSATVTYKQDHELMQTGPYAYVRHPIYTGILTMLLGTAIVYGAVAGFLALLVCVIGLSYKWRIEEALMTEHFPETYPAYKKRVKAIIPYVL